MIWEKMSSPNAQKPFAVKALVCLLFQEDEEMPAVRN